MKTRESSGISLYWDGKDLTVEPYHSKQKHYFCGRHLLKFTNEKVKVYTILVIDLEECCCADVYSDGEIQVLFQKHSEVPHKHRKGGQSAARFARIRDNEITLWYKRINEWLKSVDNEIEVGINQIYKKRFLNKLSTYNKEKINRMSSTEYSNITGIYQYMNKINEEKKKGPIA